MTNQDSALVQVPPPYTVLKEHIDTLCSAVPRYSRLNIKVESPELYLQNLEWVLYTMDKKDFRVPEDPTTLVSKIDYLIGAYSEMERKVKIGYVHGIPADLMKDTQERLGFISTLTYIRERLDPSMQEVVPEKQQKEKKPPRFTYYQTLAIQIGITLAVISCVMGALCYYSVFR